MRDVPRDGTKDQMNGDQVMHFAKPPALEPPPETSACCSPLLAALRANEEGRFEDANYFLLDAIGQDRCNAAAHMVLGQNLLRMGIWEPGWDELLWQWQMPEAAMEDRPLATWNGMPLKSGQPLLVIADGGHGDVFMYSRFLNDVCQRCEEVVFGVFTGTVPFWQSVLANKKIRIVDREEDIGRVACYIRLSGLPYTLKARPADVSHYSNGYFLPPDNEAYSHMFKCAAAQHGTGKKIGIAWQGSLGHANDKRRSVPINYCRDLAAVAAERGASFYAVQPLHESVNRDVLSQALGQTLYAPLPFDATWLDTTYLLKELDLVICVDTGVAHLAGAMGIPTWLAISRPADWRWGIEGKSSIWYSSVSLYRQKTPGDWPSVFMPMAEDLRR